jgi:hypothetical protein
MGWSDCLDAGSLRRDYALPGSFLILVLDFDDVSSSRDRARDLEQQSRSISHSGFGSAMTGTLAQRLWDALTTLGTGCRTCGSH